MARGKGNSNSKRTLRSVLHSQIVGVKAHPGDLIVLCGIPGSGKSTLISRWEELNPGALNVISTDQLRGLAPNSAGEWDQGASKWAFNTAHKQAIEAMDRGEQIVIFDSTAAQSRARKMLIDLAKQNNRDVHLVYIEQDLEVAKLQNELRGLKEPMRLVPNEVIERMASSLEGIGEDEFRREGFASVVKITTVNKEDKVQELHKLIETNKSDSEINKDGKLIHSALMNDRPIDELMKLREQGELERILPEVTAGIGYDQGNPHHSFTLFEHTMGVLAGVAQHDNEVLRWAALLHDIGKPGTRWEEEKEWVDTEGNTRTHVAHYYAKFNKETKRVEGTDHEVLGARMTLDVMGRLGIDGDTQRRVARLVRHHMFNEFKSEQAAKKFLNRVGDDIADDLLLLRIGDRNGKKEGVLQEDYKSVTQMQKLVNQARLMKDRGNDKKLAITGNDLIKELHIKPGPGIGEMIQDLKRLVDDNKIKNQRDELLGAARNLL